MRLDCIETKIGNWQIIDTDNNNKQMCVRDTVDDAWYWVVHELVAIINEASNVLKGG